MLFSPFEASGLKALAVLETSSTANSANDTSETWSRGSLIITLSQFKSQVAGLEIYSFNSVASGALLLKDISAGADITIWDFDL